MDEALVGVYFAYQIFKVEVMAGLFNEPHSWVGLNRVTVHVCHRRSAYLVAALRPKPCDIPVAGIESRLTMLACQTVEHTPVAVLVGRRVRRLAGMYATPGLTYWARCCGWVCVHTVSIAQVVLFVNNQRSLQVQVSAR
jgi:hypothetical protein